MISLPLTTATTQRRPRLSLALGGVILAALLVLPFLALLPATHPLHLSEWMLTLLGKILCYAIMAVALDLVWGYAGMLSLGHGLFFALGGYAMGMYLMRQAAGDGLPGFMSFLSWHQQFFRAVDADCAGAGPAGAAVRLFRVSLKNQRRVFLNHDPGADLGRDVAVLS